MERIQRSDVRHSWLGKMSLCSSPSHDTVLPDIFALHGARSFFL